MKENLDTRDLILRLQDIKEKQKLSVQDIQTMLEAAGYHLAPNSIRKVFSQGAEKLQFRFHDTIQPISRVLLGIYGEESGDLEVDGLKAAIKVKDELIARLEGELAEVRISSGQRADFLMQQIRLKDERIDRLMSRVDEVLGSNGKLLAQIQELISKLHIE